MNSNKQQTMTNNKQQTAVEQFIQKLEEKAIADRVNQIHIVIDVNEYLELKEQAKAIHREEIKSTFYEGAFRESCESGQRYKYVGEEDAEKFYNETYGGK
jgi:hypothetical protein